MEIAQKEFTQMHKFWTVMVQANGIKRGNHLTHVYWK